MNLYYHSLAINFVSCNKNCSATAEIWKENEMTTAGQTNRQAGYSKYIFRETWRTTD